MNDAPLQLEIVPATPKPPTSKELETAIGRLRPRERVFVEHYLQSGNAAQSARQAGWRKEIAHQAGYRLCHRRDIKAILEMAVKASGADSASRMIRAVGVAQVMHDRTLDGSLPIQERALAGKLWSDAETLLGDLDKTTFRQQAETRAYTGPVNPALAAMLADLNSQDQGGQL